MCKYFVVVFLFFSVHSISQQHLEGNNVRATFHDHSLFFHDTSVFNLGYEFPKDSNTHLIYKSAIWMAGLDDDSLKHVAADYFEHDFSYGPISNDYNSSYYTTTFDGTPWKVTRDQVNYHTANYLGQGYVPDPAIANWPGNGNSNEGVSAQLAPYVDVNNDQLYNPMDGDYPYFQGDEAILYILNDEANIHVNTGGMPIGAEIHVLFYQFESLDPEINNTTFMSYKIFNRRSFNYPEFHFGFWTNFSIGSSNDDYCGSDSLRSMMYAYNGDATDNTFGGYGSYESNPPACGIKFLNHQAGGSLYHNVYGGANGDPSNATDYYLYLNNIWQNGQPTLYGGNGYNVTTGGPSNWFFGSMPNDSTGWSEVTEQNPPGNRKMLLSSTSQPLPPGGEICFDMAIFVNNAQGDPIGNVVDLYNTADNVQLYYDMEIQPCSQVFLSVEQSEAIEVNVFPNPSQGSFTIKSQAGFIYEVFDLNGRLVQKGLSTGAYTNIDLNAQNGVYILQINVEDQTQKFKIQVIQ